jgi:hypothetical protein
MVDNRTDYYAVISDPALGITSIANADYSTITITPVEKSYIMTYINGVLVADDSAAAVSTQAIDMKAKDVLWENGENTLLIKVRSEDPTSEESTYTVKVTCKKYASALATLSIDDNPVLVANKTVYDNVSVNTINSTVKLTSVSGTASITYSINDGTEITTLSPSFAVTWPKEKDNKLVIKVNEEGKAETVYTLNVSMKFSPSWIEDYVTIDGDTIHFSSKTGSYTTHSLQSDVVVTLDPSRTMDTIKLEVNAVLYGSAPTTGTDSEGRPTYTFKNVNWKSGSNTLKVYVKYVNWLESVYTVSVNSSADNLALASVSITGDPAMGNYKNGASGVKLYGSMNKVTATSADPAATVTINVYGDVATSPYPNVKSGTGTVTVDSIAWNQDGNESNRIDVIVENGGYSRTYSITGSYKGATP